MGLRQENRVLLVQRPGSGRWANLWEFPHAVLEEGETHEKAVVRLLRELTGLQGQLGPELTTIRHGVTRYAIELVCFAADYRKGSFRSNFYQQGKWLTPAELTHYPVTHRSGGWRGCCRPGRQQNLF